MIIVFKLCLKDQGTILCLYSLSVKIITSKVKEQYCNGNIYHIFKPNKFRNVQNLYQEKPSMDMTLSEFKNLTNICWSEKYQPLTIDMTKDKFTGRYRIGLKSIFLPDSSPF